MGIANRRSGMDLTSGTTKELIGKVIRYSIPIVFVGVLEFLFNTFDLIVIEGKETNLEASAVGANAALIALLTNVFIGLSTGENVVIAKYYGRNDPEGAERAAVTGLVVSVASGALVLLIGYFMTPTLLKAMNVEEDYFPLAVSYLQIYFFALPFMSIYNFGSAIFRGIGDSKTPMVFLIVSGLVHIGLDFLFIDGFDMSVVGAGLSNVIAYALAAVLVLAFLRFKGEFFRFRIKRIRVYAKELKEIIAIGVPSGLQGMIFAVSNLILQSTVNTWGPTVVAVNADCESIENICYIAMFSVAQAGSAFVSANFSAGKSANVKKLIWILEGCCLVLGLSVGLVELAAFRPLIQAYKGGKADEAFFSLAFERLSLMLPLYFICGCMDNFTNILRGMGKATVPMVISVVCICGFRIFWNYAVYSPVEGSPMHSTLALYLCYPVSWVMSFGLQLIYFAIVRKKLWATMVHNGQTLAKANPNPIR